MQLPGSPPSSWPHINSRGRRALGKREDMNHGAGGLWALGTQQRMPGSVPLLLSWLWKGSPERGADRTWIVSAASWGNPSFLPAFPSPDPRHHAFPQAHGPSENHCIQTRLSQATDCPGPTIALAGPALGNRGPGMVGMSGSSVSGTSRE